MAVLRAASITPTVVISLPSDLFECVDGQTRSRLVEYTTELARGCEIKLVATGRLQQRLIFEYDSLFTEGVANSPFPRHAGSQPSAAVESTVHSERTSLPHTERSDE